MNDIYNKNTKNKKNKKISNLILFFHLHLQNNKIKNKNKNSINNYYKNIKMEKNHQIKIN